MTAMQILSVRFAVFWRPIKIEIELYTMLSRHLFVNNSLILIYYDLRNLLFEKFRLD